MIDKSQKNYNKIFFFRVGIVKKVYQSLDYLVFLYKSKPILAKLSSSLVRREILPNLNAKVKVKIYITDLQKGQIDAIYRFAEEIKTIHKKLQLFQKYLQ